MFKQIIWTFDGKSFKGFANLINKRLTLTDSDGRIFDSRTGHNLKAMQKAFEAIPEDVSDFKLKNLALTRTGGPVRTR